MQKRVVDLIMVCICLAVIGIAWLYPNQVREQSAVTLLAGALALLFLVLAVKDQEEMKKSVGRTRMGLPSDSELITEIVLLSEEDTELMAWDLYGKVAAVIGREGKENQVDIDLAKSHYASMVDPEHAVMNFSSGNWYVEDLGSSNGISIKKSEDGKVYKLSSDNPCRLERGDCLYIGLNRLLLR